MSDRLVRFSGDSWQEIEALPESVRSTVQRVIFHLLEDRSRRLPTRSLNKTRCPGPTSCTSPLTG